MKKVTAFVGSARKKNTYNSVKLFLSNLETFGNVESEIVFLNEFNIKPCIGCILCFEKGEENCPLKDGRDILLDKINNSDGVIFATPNYSFQVSGFLKIFVDRTAFNLHRPRYFGKVFTNIVTQGFFGGKKINKYLDFVASGLGFNVVKGISLTTLEPIPEEKQKKKDKAIKELSNSFFEYINKSSLPVPAAFKLMIFRMSRTGIKMSLSEDNRDYTYYKEKGWFESDYFYEVSLGFFKKFIGILFDFLGEWMAKKKIQTL